MWLALTLSRSTVLPFAGTEIYGYKARVEGQVAFIMALV